MRTRPDTRTAGSRLAVALKACPRCLGDLIRRSDSLGPDYYGCLQCGAEIEARPKPQAVSS